MATAEKKEECNVEVSSLENENDGIEYYAGMGIEEFSEENWEVLWRMFVNNVLHEEAKRQAKRKRVFRDDEWCILSKEDWISWKTDELENEEDGVIGGNFSSYVVDVYMDCRD